MNTVQHYGEGSPEERFVERMGQHFEDDGFSRIAGRILGYLMLQTEPQSLDALADSLRVSKASVSNNTRMLEGLGALERVTHPGDRRDYYQVADLMHERMIELRVKRFQATQALVSEGLQTGAARDPVVRSRLESVCTFFEHMIKTIRATQQCWQRDHGEAE